MEGAGLTITGLIATVLSLIFAFAVYATNRKRRQDREALQAAVKAREDAAAGIPPEPADGLISKPPPARAQVAAVQERPPPAPNNMPAQPPSAPVRPSPRAAPASSGPPVFRRYVTRPGDKTPTQVAVQAPSDQDFVWE